MRTHEHGNTLCSCVPHHAPCSRRRPPHVVRPIPPAPAHNPTNASEALRTARDIPPAHAHGPAYPTGIRTTAPADLTAGQAARAARNTAAEQAARTARRAESAAEQNARSAEPAAARIQSGLPRQRPARNPTNASEALRTARDIPPAPAHGPAYPAGPFPALRRYHGIEISRPSSESCNRP